MSEKLKWNIDGLVQERRNSSALAMELRLSCTKPSIWGLVCQKQIWRTGTRNYIPRYTPQHLWDVFTFPCLLIRASGTKEFERIIWPSTVEAVKDRSPLFYLYIHKVAIIYCSKEHAGDVKNKWCLSAALSAIGLCTCHYSNAIINAMASQITGVSIVYSTVLQAQIRENIKVPRHWQFVREIHRWPVNAPHKRPVTRKMFPFDDVILYHQSAVPALLTNIFGTATRIFRANSTIILGYPK